MKKPTAQQVDTLATIQAAFIIWYLGYHKVPQELHGHTIKVTLFFREQDHKNGFYPEEKQSLTSDWISINHEFSMALVNDIIDCISDPYEEVIVYQGILKSITGQQQITKS